jgi:hypothetical protein
MQKKQCQDALFELQIVWIDHEPIKGVDFFIMISIVWISLPERSGDYW